MPVQHLPHLPVSIPVCIVYLIPAYVSHERNEHPGFFLYIQFPKLFNFHPTMNCFTFTWRYWRSVSLAFAHSWLATSLIACCFAITDFGIWGRIASMSKGTVDLTPGIAECSSLCSMLVLSTVWSSLLSKSCWYLVLTLEQILIRYKQLTSLASKHILTFWFCALNRVLNFLEISALPLKMWSGP